MPKAGETPRAPHDSGSRKPHAATVAQPKRPLFSPRARSPHAATQPNRARPTHPAALQAKHGATRGSWGGGPEDRPRLTRQGLPSSVQRMEARHGCTWGVPQGEAVERALRLYEKGLLLVTSVQRKDLPKMHNGEALAAVAKCVTNGGRIAFPNPKEFPLVLNHAKVNWALTSPRMRPHYFKITVGKEESERGPKPEPVWESPVTAPRVATLADATAMGCRYLAGKTGNLSDWHADQSSGKTAGVTHDARLYDYEEVAQHLLEIKQEQEREYREDQPEINTFGFPPQAVVGFLVNEANDRNKEALEAARVAMGASQEGRTFPIFTWKSVSEKRWVLVPIGELG